MTATEPKSIAPISTQLGRAGWQTSRLALFDEAVGVWRAAPISSEFASATRVCVRALNALQERSGSALVKSEEWRQPRTAGDAENVRTENVGLTSEYETISKYRQRGTWQRQGRGIWRSLRFFCSEPDIQTHVSIRHNLNQ